MIRLLHRGPFDALSDISQSFFLNSVLPTLKVLVLRKLKFAFEYYLRSENDTPIGETPAEIVRLNTEFYCGNYLRTFMHITLFLQQQQQHVFRHFIYHCNRLFIMV